MWWTRCPTCGAPTEPVKLTGFRRMLRQLAAANMPMSIADDNPARRQCPRCGVVKVKPLRHAPHECQACGYNLVGSHSDHCPECGWELPPAMREYLEHKAYGPAHGSVR
jgi:ribosomal protein L37E